jgi:DNA-binding HxlR family transcriptional regulator
MWVLSNERKQHAAVSLPRWERVTSVKPPQEHSQPGLQPRAAAQQPGPPRQLGRVQCWLGRILPLKCMFTPSNPSLRPDPEALSEALLHDHLRLQDAQRCPVQWVLSRVGDTWSMPLLVELGRGERRFRELQRCMVGISPRMLTRALRALEQDGLVDREAHPGPAQAVTYRLTPQGCSLVWALRPLLDWAESTAAELRTARSERELRATPEPGIRIVRLMKTRGAD